MNFRLTITAIVKNMAYIVFLVTLHFVSTHYGRKLRGLLVFSLAQNVYSQRTVQHLFKIYQ